jgi:hypothetical protein
VSEKVEFLPDGIPTRKRGRHFDELTANPGVWALWWGSTANAAHKAAYTTLRPGFRFEAKIVDGVGYIRSVATDKEETQ